jgi:tRNA (guanine37-N1)-methyltransferase
MSEDLCLRVERKSGEQIRKLMLRRGLLDHSRRIAAVGGFVFIPLSRSPTPPELEEAGAASTVEVCSEKLPAQEPKSSSLPEILSGRLPPELVFRLPRSYDVVGDIMLLETLDPELAPYRGLVGSALLEMNPGLKTVLVKVGKVEGEFRVPRLEAIAGLHSFETIHMEYGLRLKVDLSKAYFSPRLGYERHRVAQAVNDGETIVDMFAGVGPFSLMIAKRAMVRVYAIDKNPDAIDLLRENMGLNMLRGEVIPICDDARAVAEKIPHMADRVIMNLPGSSLEFLEAATKFLRESGGNIHLYTFTPDQTLAEAKERLLKATQKIGGRFELRNSRVVKPVAPRRWQAALDIFFVADRPIPSPL